MIIFSSIVTILRRRNGVLTQSICCTGVYSLPGAGSKKTLSLEQPVGLWLYSECKEGPHGGPCFVRGTESTPFEQADNLMTS